MDTIYLTGGGALMEGLPGALEKNLDVKIKILESPSTLNFSIDNVRQEFQQNFVRYVVAFGAAL